MDIGCGPGSIVHLLPIGVKYVGFDTRALANSPAFVTVTRSARNFARHLLDASLTGTAVNNILRAKGYPAHGRLERT